MRHTASRVSRLLALTALVVWTLLAGCLAEPEPAEYFIDYEPPARPPSRLDADTGFDADASPDTDSPDAPDGPSDTEVDTGSDTGPDTAAPTCDDGRHNGRETDVDCGGPDCQPCEVGGQCETDADCPSAEPGVWESCPPTNFCARRQRCRTVTEYRCQQGECVEQQTEECESCSNNCTGWRFGGQFSHENAPVHHATFSADGESFAFVHEADTEQVYIHDGDTGSRLETVQSGFPQGQHGLTFSPTDRWLAVLGKTGDDRRGFRIYDTTQYVETASATPVRNWAHKGAAFSRDGQHLAWGRGNGHVRIHETSNWSRTQTLRGDDWRSYEQDYSESYFAHTNDDGVFVYDYPSYSQGEHFEEGHKYVVALSNDDRWLAYRDGSQASQLIVRRAGGDWVKIQTFSETGDDMGAVDFTGDGEHIAYAQGSTIYIRDTDGWQLMERFDHPGGSIRTLEFSEQTDRLIVGADDNRAYGFCRCR